jgi:hypothetical protein
MQQLRCAGQDVNPNAAQSDEFIAEGVVMNPRFLAKFQP